MKLIILPGFSLRNRDEQVLIGSKLTEAGYEVYEHQWRHWINPNESFDVQIEAAAVMDHISPNLEYGLITKSIGGYVGLNLIDKGATKPRFAIFMGVGAKDLGPEEQKRYPEVLTQINIPIIFVHNTHDDHGGSEELKEMLGTELKYELVEKEADHHMYSYPDEVLELVKRFAN